LNEKHTKKFRLFKLALQARLHTNTNWSNHPNLSDFLDSKCHRIQYRSIMQLLLQEFEMVVFAFSHTFSSLVHSRTLAGQPNSRYSIDSILSMYLAVGISDNVQTVQKSHAEISQLVQTNL